MATSSESSGSEGSEGSEGSSGSETGSSGSETGSSGSETGSSGSESKSVKYLWLLRHAKATPHGRRGGSDYERPLTTRGRRDANALGIRLAAGVGVFGLEGVPGPQLALSSSAARTSETGALVADGMAASLPIDNYRSLYQAGTETILQYVREIDDEIISAMVVGHNPTIYRLAWELLPGDGGAEGLVGPDGRESYGRESDGREQLKEHGFPTCSLAVLILPIASWSEVTEESASLAGVFSPPY